MFKRFRTDEAKARLLEESYFNAVSNELENGIKGDGLWLKAFSESNGDHEKTKAKYIKLRVQAMRDEDDIMEAAVSEELKVKQAEEARRHRERRREEELASPDGFLKDKGYKVTHLDGSAWKVREPLGGICKLGSFEALVEYARPRGWKEKAR